MKIVLDASAAYQLLLATSIDPVLAESTSRLAPELIVPELLNARRNAVRAGVYAPPLDATLDLLSRLQLAPMAPFARAAAELAERLDHAVYDCFYVALAQRHDAKLVTADQRLRRKLTSHGLAGVLASSR